MNSSNEKTGVTLAVYTVRLNLQDNVKTYRDFLHLRKMQSDSDFATDLRDTDESVLMEQLLQRCLNRLEEEDFYV